MIKEVKFHESSRKDLIGFPVEIRREAGLQIARVQHGMEPSKWKPMKTVGQGAKEIILTGDDGIYRVIYVAEYKGRVHVLHAFQKKSQKTRKSDIDLAKRRYKAMKND